MSERLLSIYLEDRLALATTEVELARRAHGSNRDGDLGDALAEIRVEAEADRATLRELAERLGGGESRLKSGGAWLGEKAGRLKLNGQIRGYSPLSRVIELEALCVSLAAKEQMWQALGPVLAAKLPDVDFEGLAERAAAQRRLLEPHRQSAVALALQP